MKNNKKRNFRGFCILLAALFILGPVSVKAQDYTELEEMQDKSMDYVRQIYKIVDQYPAFAYEYQFENGEVKNVTVTGVDNELDKKRLEVVIFDLQSNRNKMKNKENRIGVFYSTDTRPEYEHGREQLRTTIQGNLEYPDEIKNWGVEGTVYVKFVVDENGEIPFITASEDIESSQEFYVKELRRIAIDAVKTTSGNWEPAEVEGVDVSSLMVVPVTFDFRKHPFIPVLL